MESSRRIDIWSSVGLAFVLQVLASALLFGMHAVLANWLGPGQYGVINYALVIAGFVTIIVVLGLPDGSMRFASEYTKAGQWELLKGLTIRSGQLVLLMSLSVGMLIVFISGFTEDKALSKSLFYSGLLLPLIAVGFWRGKIIRGMSRLKESILPEEVIRPGFVIIAILIISIFFEPSAEYAFYALLTVFVGSLLVGMVWLSRAVEESTANRLPHYEGRKWLGVSLPIMIAALFQEVMNRSDLLILGAAVGMEETGLYSAAARIALLNVFMLKVVDIVVAPRIAASFNNGDIANTRAIITNGTVISTLGSAPLFLFMFIWPEWILLLFGDEFIAASQYLQILIFGQFINALTGPVGHALIMTGHERVFLKVVAGCSIVVLTAHLIVIPQYGALGAAYVTASGVVLMNLLLFYMMKKILFSSFRVEAG